MIDVEPLIVSELERMLPLPDGSRADWTDVLRRSGVAGGRRLQRPRLALALAALVAVAASVAATTPVRAAIARGFDGFSAWISGEPGTPASPAEQQAFEQQNERTWSGFAPGTRLRRLIATKKGGVDYTLYGFRSGAELCLRLVSTGAVDRASNHCATREALQTAKEPALVVAAGWYVAGPRGRSGAAATFGIASDGVARILVHAEDGKHVALVAANAFLLIDSHGNLGGRTRGLDAIATNGERVALPFQTRGHGTTSVSRPPHAPAPGPTKVQRHVSGGTVAWIDHLQHRGRPIPPNQLQTMLGPLFQRLGKPLLARRIQPDPKSPLRVDVLVLSPSGSITDPKAALLVSGGGESLQRPFPAGPIDEVFGLASSADQFTTISGLASDAVASIRIFLASGKTIRVPLKDNVFAVEIERAVYPIRIVGYDKHGEVIYTRSFKDV